MDSSRWQAKRGMPEDDMAQNIPERLEERVRITWEEVEEAAVDRSRWRQAAARCAELHGRNCFEVLLHLHPITSILQTTHLGNYL